MNIRLDIEYDGADFHGWQRQPDRPTIQAILEDAISQVVRRRVVLYGASRTDSGVHARGQVANFYTKEGDPLIPAERWRLVLNTALPPTIRIIAATQMPEHFHAQKDAVKKRYEYRLLHRGYSSALDRRVFFYPHPLDWEAIRAALPYFVGTKDFQAFQASGSKVLTTVRTIHRFEVVEESFGLYRFEIEGSGFLKQMVRNILGTLIEIGEGKRLVSDIPQIFLSQDRRMAGRTVPANGLCLVCIEYPEFDKLSPWEANGRSAHFSTVPFGYLGGSVRSWVPGSPTRPPVTDSYVSSENSPG